MRIPIRGGSGIGRQAAGLPLIPCPAPSVVLSRPACFRDECLVLAGREVFLTLAVGTSVHKWHTGLCQGKASLGKTFPASTSDPRAPVNPCSPLFSSFIIVTLCIPDSYTLAQPVNTHTARGTCVTGVQLC